MKRRIFCIIFALAILLGCLGCSPDTPTTGSTGGSVPSTSTSQGIPTDPLPPNTTVPTPPTTITTIPPELRGQVRLYTCDAALYEAYCRMGADYTAIYGVEVVALLGQGGSCRESLAAFMGSEQVPTVFCLHSEADMEYWAANLYDLTGSAVVSQLYSTSLTHKSDGKILAVPVDVEGYGLIYNASLLAQAGFTRSDIVDYAYFELVCKRITKEKPGFYTFSGLDFSNTDHGGLACLLTGMLPEAEQLKSFLELYMANDKNSTNPLNQFLTEKTLFYVGGTWDYDKVASLGDNKLDILPAYGPNGGNLQCIARTSWGVNSQVEARDIRETLDFLRWIVTSHGGQEAPVDRLQLLSPYKDAAYYSNKLQEKLRIYMASEPVVTKWDCCDTDGNQRSALSEALKTYTKDPSAANWQKVLEAWNKKD